MSDLRFKRVAWISDRSYPEYKGGAEKTEYVLMEIGRKKYSLTIDYWDKKPDKEYDFCIIGNTHTWPPEKVFDLIEDKKFAFFSHDPLSKEQTWTLLRKAFCVIFMSPAHEEYYTKKFEIKNSIYQPPAFEEEELESFHSEKKEEYALYIGDLNEYKGIQNVYSYAKDHPDMEFKIFGRNFVNANFTLPNFKYYGWLPKERMQEELGKAKYFIHLPSLVDPGPHMVIKAYLSDCELIVNRNVGVLSFKEWNWEDKEDIKKKLREFQNTFWERLNEHV